jgi:hypothetical protein
MYSRETDSLNNLSKKNREIFKISSLATYRVKNSFEAYKSANYDIL